MLICQESGEMGIGPILNCFYLELQKKLEKVQTPWRGFK